MQLYICYDIDSLPLEQALQRVSPQRRTQVLAYKPEGSRRRCAGAYLLLCHALRTGWGIHTLPQLAYEEGGKPYLPQFPHIHFNVSHCRGAVACVVDSRPVGVDVEDVRRYRRDLAEYVCSDEEMSRILASEDPAKAFIRLWTMKEATLKLTGEGLRNNLRTALRPDVFCATFACGSQGCFCTVASWQPLGRLVPIVVEASQLVGVDQANLNSNGF